MEVLWQAIWAFVDYHPLPQTHSLHYLDYMFIYTVYQQNNTEDIIKTSSQLIKLLDNTIQWEKDHEIYNHLQDLATTS